MTPNHQFGAQTHGNYEPGFCASTTSDFSNIGLATLLAGEPPNEAPWCMLPVIAIDEVDWEAGTLKIRTPSSNYASILAIRDRRCVMVTPCLIL